VKKPTITEFNTMRLPSSSARRVAGTLRLAWQVGNTHQVLFDDQSAALLSVPERSA